MAFETVRPDKSISSQSAVTLNSLVLVPVSCNPSILSFHTFYITLSFIGSVLVASGAIHSTKVSLVADGTRLRWSGFNQVY